MKDIDKFFNLFDEFGIEYKEDIQEFQTVITCVEGVEKVEGYYRFFTDFEFGKTGNFVVMGVYE